MERRRVMLLRGWAETVTAADYAAWRRMVSRRLVRGSPMGGADAGIRMANGHCRDLLEMAKEKMLTEKKEEGARGYL